MPMCITLLSDACGTQQQGAHGPQYTNSPPIRSRASSGHAASHLKDIPEAQIVKAPTLFYLTPLSPAPVAPVTWERLHALDIEGTVHCTADDCS